MEMIDVISLGTPNRGHMTGYAQGKGAADFTSVPSCAGTMRRGQGVLQAFLGALRQGGVPPRGEA